VIGLPINYVIIVYDEISGDNLDGYTPWGSCGR
jgi:hypothetical protein